MLNNVSSTCWDACNSSSEDCSLFSMGAASEHITNLSMIAKQLKINKKMPDKTYNSKHTCLGIFLWYYNILYSLSARFQEDMEKMNTNLISLFWLETFIRAERQFMLGVSCL